MSRKVMIIGLDGATWTVLNPMIAKGYMPRLKSMVESGRPGILASTEPPITPTAWTSFQTGLPPHVHRLFGFFKFIIDEGRLRIRIINSADVGFKRIWDIFSENGKKTCILNLPMTYPPFPVNGAMMSGFPIPSRDAVYTYPQELKSELLGVVPDLRVMSWGIGSEQEEPGVEELASKWAWSMHQKVQIASHMIKREPWDVFMVHIQETDILQHFLWHCLDETDPCHNPDDFHKAALFYRQVDDGIGAILDEAQKQDYSAIVLSDHGFQRCRYDLKLNNWLMQRGWLALKKDAKAIAISVLRRIWNLKPLRNLKGRIWRAGAVGDSLHRQYLDSVIDYRKSAVILELNGVTNIGFAHFLKNDRATIDKVLGEMASLRDASGRLLVAEIEKVDYLRDAYKIGFVDGVTASGMVPYKGSWLDAPVPLKNHVGMHHRDGIIVLDRSLADCAMPSDICEVPRLLLTLQGLGSEALDFGQPGDLPEGPGGEDESKLIESQLKDLGYL